MALKIFLLLCKIIASCLAIDVINNKFFPDDFSFGAATASYQIEGTSDYINKAGVEYYKNLLKELKDNNITALVTLYHWDLPQVFQEEGGWLNETLMDKFVEYTKVCFQEFGDDVKTWLTFNEVKSICVQGYENGTLAPGIRLPGIAAYQCTHTILKAHAKVWHVYDEEFREIQKGKIGTVVDTHWMEPETNSTADQEATERKLQFEFGWYAHPIVFGDYPEIMKTRIAERSKKEGFNESRLPILTEEEIAYIKGTYDYFGLNSYSTKLVRSIPEPEIGSPSCLKDVGVLAYQPDDWEGSEASWIKVVPWGMKKLLIWIKENYNDPEIIITENGYADKGGLNDQERQSYLLPIRTTDSVKRSSVIAYNSQQFHVKITEMFNHHPDYVLLFSHYRQKFGLYHVDFQSPNKTRIPKASVEFYKKVAETHCLLDECVSD